YRAAASRRMAGAGYPRGPLSSSRSECLARYSDVCSSPGSSSSTMTDGSPSSVSWRSSPTAALLASTLPGAEEALGGLRQAAVRRTRSDARLPVALYAPRCDLEQPADRLRRSERHLPLHGLSP